ncbi:uncharacterized protein LOC128171661 [Crassostrea angulata]|uniref:uncharacterized protein LOC128171661 n=1 Tax=Magallana angulata TaxID=2784310 RepID=UPI0022B1FD70|nr:uncharacterized protein LOC128171661 [Crassostrea angulata]
MTLYFVRSWVLRLFLFFFLALFCKTDLKHGYSMLQYGHKLERRMITSYDKYSILHCVEDCLRTTRCRSVNYHQGAHFCQTNFEDRTTVPDLYMKKSGWIYSDIEDWDKGIAGACSVSNCSLNEKCISQPFGQYTCVLSDCGIPSNEGFSMEDIQEWDAIGIARGIHIRCALGFNQQGSEFFVCRSNGSWRMDLNCTLKTCPVGYKEAASNVTKTCLRFVDTPTYYPNATLDCQEDDGNLIKLDTEPLKNIFLKFIDGYIDKTTNNNIWIQAEEDGEGIWRFHDGSTLPDFLKRDMNETNDRGEIYLRYVIDKQQFWDIYANILFSYICEYRIY